MIAGKNAATADLVALQKAQALADAGAVNKDIYTETGWFRGGDGLWRFEISDSAAYISVPGKVLTALKQRREDPEGRTADPDTILVDYIDHPKLFAAYPQLRTVRARIPWANRSDEDSKVLGSADMLGRAIYYEHEYALAETQVARTTLHEIQHLIQGIEGFALGASDTLWQKRRQQRGTTPKMKDIQMYRSTYGEQEARNTEARMQMSADERKVEPPFGVEENPDSRLEIAAGMGHGRSGMWVEFNSVFVLRPKKSKVEQENEGEEG